MDYNTQRKAVSAIDSFGRRHKLLLPLCLAAKLFTIIFCAIVRFFDMTLSDDKGRFLGIESGKKPRSAGIPEDTGEKKHIQLRHRPLIWRALSFTLALAFMFMIVPHGMEIRSFAAGITITDINGDSILDTGEYNIGTTGCDLEASDFAGAGITGIGEGAFANKGNIYTADLSNITKIGDNAFYGAYSLTRVKLNPAITADDIGDNAFVGLAPDSVLIYQGTDPDVLNKLKAVIDNKKTTVINNNPPAVSDVSAITDYVTARGKTLIAFTPVSGAVDYAVYCRKNAGSGYERIASYDKYSFSDGRLGISVDDGKLGSNGNQVFLAVRVIDGQGNYRKHFTETPNAVVLR